ncbi:unnamed protein product [Paramecium sonneborni]|uniref:Uncharacterized protein n=1 Tax=Paramecium sonneborni TaxID=65129 RepID=A0A8S1MYU0_9CILI|nr:unnamed protein product [Paramecium sonneborni]
MEYHQLSNFYTYSCMQTIMKKIHNLYCLIQILFIFLHQTNISDNHDIYDHYQNILQVVTLFISPSCLGFKYKFQFQGEYLSGIFYIDFYQYIVLLR